MIRGPDVSAYQSDIDWGLVRTSSEFALVKITQGNGIVNPKATEQVLGASRAGLLVMLYHYCQPNGPNWDEDAAAEGMRLDEIADGFEQKLGRQILTFADVERNTPLTPVERPLWRGWTNTLRRWCREEGERVLAFYSGKYFTMDLGLDLTWQRTILWVAQYPAIYRPDADYGFWPKNIAPWLRADLWQDGGGDDKATGGNESTCPGIGRCDMNVYAGDRPGLEGLIATAA